MRALIPLLLGLVILGLVAHTSPGSEPLRIVQPTQGRPAFVPPGGSLAVVVAEAGEQNVRLALAEPRTGARVELACTVDGELLRAVVPPETPLRTYDLELRAGELRLVAPRAVAVAKPGARLRLVQLGDMQVGDPSAPHFDRRLIEEINLLAPTAILATGDYLAATHPDAAAGWTELSSFLAEFDAPVLMARGDHDDPSLFSRWAAPSPLGVVTIGPHTVLILADTPEQPLRDDVAQERWFESQLRTTQAADGLRLVMSHAPTLDPLRLWQERGELERRTSGSMPRLWLTGSDPPPSAGAAPGGGGAGSRATGGRAPEGWESAAWAPDLVLTHTPPSSTLRGRGATGVSHYRVLDIRDGQVCLPGSDAWPVGRLSTGLDRRADGRTARLRFSVQNGHAVPIAAARLRLLVARQGPRSPWVRGARLEAAHDLGWAWECVLRFDLPPGMSVVGTVGTDQPPPAAELDVSLSAASPAVPQPSPAVGAAAAAVRGESLPQVTIRNRGPDTIDVAPLLRIGGQTIPYAVSASAAAPAAGFRLRLAAGEQVLLQPQPTHGQFSPDDDLLVVLRTADAWETRSLGRLRLVAGRTDVRGASLESNAAPARLVVHPEQP